MFLRFTAAIEAPAVGPSPSPGVGTRLPRPEPTKRSRARPQGWAQAAHEGSDVNCCLMTLKNIFFLKKSNTKKFKVRILSSERFEKAPFGYFTSLVQGAGMPLTMCC